MMFNMSGGGMPGPGMAMKMMEGMMEGCGKGETRETFIESICESVSRATAVMSDPEYMAFVDELSKKLRNRPGTDERTSGSCC